MLNDVGFLQPGQSRETGNIVIARTCGFTTDSPGTQTLWGQITAK